MNRRIFALGLVALLICNMALAAPPPPHPGGMSVNVPGSMPPDAPGGMPPDTPSGMPPHGMPGGVRAPESYDAVYTIGEDNALRGNIESVGPDENALHIAGGAVTLQEAEISRVSDESAGGDAASFYGVGAAILATDGEVSVSDSVIFTEAPGGAGVFAYGDGSVDIADSVIETLSDCSGGIHVAGGGTLSARNLDVTTYGASSAAIRSDRGGGTMVVSGGSYTSNGAGSPAVYVTADISIRDAVLTATGAEALCVEGKNSVALENCELSGAMPEDAQNDGCWTVIVYQSMSGDAEPGQGSFHMKGGSLIGTSGGMFYTTNTQSDFVLEGVELVCPEECPYVLRCTGNRNARGWGRSGANGADCRLTAIAQALEGDVLWDSISSLKLYLTQASDLTGAILDDESCAGEGGNGSAELFIAEDSTWTVTADSRLSCLHSAGHICGADGMSVTIRDASGNTLVPGEGSFTVTVDSYENKCDLSGAGEYQGA